MRSFFSLEAILALIMLFQLFTFTESFSYIREKALVRDDYFFLSTVADGLAESLEIQDFGNLDGRLSWFEENSKKKLCLAVEGEYYYRPSCEPTLCAKTCFTYEFMGEIFYRTAEVCESK